MSSPKVNAGGLSFCFNLDISQAPRSSPKQRGLMKCGFGSLLSKRRALKLTEVRMVSSGGDKNLPGERETIKPPHECGLCGRARGCRCNRQETPLGAGARNGAGAIDKRPRWGPGRGTGPVLSTRDPAGVQGAGGDRCYRQETPLGSRAREETGAIDR